jgi:copper chaperone CopZ
MPSPDQTPHEYIDAEISIPDLKTAADEKVLNSALSGLDGIISLRVSEGNIAVEYDPIRITKAEIGEIISKAGFRVAGVETGLASPFSDALYDESKDEE